MAENINTQYEDSQEEHEASVDRTKGLAPGEAGDTPSDSVVEKPDEVLPGDNSPQDNTPTHSA